MPDMDQPATGGDEAIEAGLSPVADSRVSAGSGVAHLEDQTDGGYLTITATSRYIA